MNKDLLTMEEAEVVHEAPTQRNFRMSYDRPSTMTMPATVTPSVVVAGTDKDSGGVWWSLGQFLKPSFSNLMLLGCVTGVLFVFCCSYVFHALTGPFRKQAS